MAADKPCWTEPLPGAVAMGIVSLRNRDAIGRHVDEGAP